MESWIAGLVGALIGSTGSIATVLIQNHYQSKRDRARMALEFAVQQRAEDEARARPGQAIPPISIYAHYHHGLIDMVESNRLTADRIREHSDQNALLFDSIIQAEKLRDKAG